MKKFANLTLSIAVALVLAGSSALAQPKKADANQAAHGKITKNEAQHLVLTKYPAANIKNCELKTVNGASVWIVSFTMTGGNVPQRVQVDEQTGKLTRM